MFAISPTDNHWFQFLKSSGLNSFVNFWTPTPWNIKRLKAGNRWYYLLKSPIRKIGGFGEFIEYKNLTAINAWKEYGHRNGCTNKIQLVERIQTYINKNSDKFRGKQIDIETYQIGCVILKNCQFWDEEKYQDIEDYNLQFPTQVVKYKYFPQYDPFINLRDLNINNFSLITKLRDDNKTLANQRKGQGKFKGILLKAYNNKCCISGETCPELLQAAHLQQYLNDSSNHVQNGVLLRVDLHCLFDNGLLFIDRDYVVHISPVLSSPAYTQFNGVGISLPENQYDHPSKEGLELKRKDFRA